MGQMKPADPDQFTALMRQYGGLLHKVAYAYCRNAADREDVVQEIATQLWRAWANFDPSLKATTWVYRIALNVAISFYRRERRHREGRQPIEDHLLAVPGETTAPSEEVQCLLRCIDDLGAIDKAIVLLYLDGNDHASIGDVLGLTPTNVGTKVHRIKGKLRAAFAARTLPQSRENPHATR